MDAQKVASDGLSNVCKLFLKDLEAIPEDAYGRGFGGASRTVGDIVHEVNMVNDHIGMTIRGEKPFDFPEGLVFAPEDLQSKQAVIGAFRTSSDRLIETVGALTTAQMEEPMQTDDGESTRFAQIRFATVHLWYHSGQLNFIQTLLGDSEWHWN